MKICVLIDELASGSAPKTVGQEVRGLSTLGYDAEAMVIKSGYSPTYDFHLSGVRIRSISKEMPIIKALDVRFPGFSFFSVHHMTSALLSPLKIKEREWDMIISIGAYTCFTAQALKRTRKIPYLAFIATEPYTYTLPRIYSDKPLGRVLPLLMPFASFLQEYVVRDCSAVIAYSPTYIPMIKEYTNKPVEFVLPGCFPIEKLPETRENFILAFDRWDIGNNPTILLDILQKLSRSVDLVIAGYWHPPSMKESFVKEIQKRNLSKRVKILGPLDEHEIMYLCSRALLHAHPNIEAFGMSSLEAMACGCPIVIPKGSGVTKLFNEEQQRNFPDSHNVQSWVNAIDRIITDTTYARKISWKSWELAKQTTWKQHVEKLAKIIEKFR